MKRQNEPLLMPAMNSCSAAATGQPLALSPLCQGRIAQAGLRADLGQGLALVGALLLLALPARAATTPDFQGASWIWADGKGDGIELADEPSCEFALLRRSFEIPVDATIERAELSLAADNSAEAWINGQPVGSCRNWMEPLAVDVAAHLRPGVNAIALQAQTIDLPRDPGGVIARLRVDYQKKDGSKGQLNLVSDDQWRGTPVAVGGWKEAGFADGTWARAVALTPLGGFPWGYKFPGAGTGLEGTFPEFRVGQDSELLHPLREILRRQYLPGITCTLWDPWMPRSLLWIGLTPNAVERGMRAGYRNSFLGRQLSPAGYVEMRQHRGLGLPDGWPFPLWTQGAGKGWHFSTAAVPYGKELGIIKTSDLTGWDLQGAKVAGFDELEGLRLTLTEANASLTTSTFHVEKKVAPYVRLEWRSQDLPRTARPYLEWTTETQTEFAPDRRLYFDPVQPTDGLVFTILPLFQVPGWDGPLTRFRIAFDNPAGTKVSIAALFTAVDTRLPITNPDFILGSTDFLNWTGDTNFLRAQINRLRLATAYMLTEFGVEKNGVAYVPWPGHEGRSGVVWEGEKKIIRNGEGLGNNYFDLMPFGAHDAYLNVRIYAALRAMTQLEAAVATHPQWNLPDSPLRRSSGELAAIAERLKQAFQKKFWNSATRRFVGSIDADGKAHDYGFTPVNMEAIVYGLASPEQAQEIYAWMDGRRTVEGDTSQGKDIYHWRLGPRMTTRRNIDYYTYVWSAPESIPFGDQIQDGGGVLGFSYYDIMARLKTLGPDDAWQRLQGILAWEREVQAYGGYRKYYADHDGTMQGGGPPGGLGIDQEFYETGMLPSVLVYGFLGLDPAPDRLAAHPRLPKDWPTLTVTDVAYRDWRFDLTADRAAKTLTALVTVGNVDTLEMMVPTDWRFLKTTKKSTPQNRAEPTPP